MNISEEMKNYLDSVELEDYNFDTIKYDWLPKIEALETENENFDNENKLLKQQQKELIEYIIKNITGECQFNCKKCNFKDMCNMKDRIIELEKVLQKKWEDIII